MSEARLNREDDKFLLLATAQIEPYQVIQLPSGEAAFLDSATAVASAAYTTDLRTRGKVTIEKTTSMVLLAGQEVYWDHSANKIHYAKVNDQDFFVGIVAEDSTAAQLTAVVDLNKRQRFDIDISRDPFLSVNTSARTLKVGTRAKVGATAGWTVAAADNLPYVATLAASQTGSTLVIPIDGLEVGDTIASFTVIAQIESAGGAVTIDGDLRAVTNVAAEPTDASIGTITQIAVTADTASSQAKTGLSEVVTSGKSYYLLITATTAAATDIILQHCEIAVVRANSEGGLQRRGGAHHLILTAANCAQKIDILSVDGFAPAANTIVELVFRVVSDGAGTAVDVSMGAANGTHATDADSITESLFVHLDANNTNIYLESDDGTTEVAATDTTLDYTEGSAVAQRVHVLFDLRTLTDIQCYVNGALALTATVFKLDAATGPLFLLAHLEKTASSDSYELALDRLRCWHSEQ